MTPAIESCHALVLNADFRPLSYFPLSIWSWQDAVKAVFLDRVSVISEYDRKIHSPSCEMNLPSVIALKEYVPAARRPAFTRFNVFLRDRFSCQYCRTSWNNFVTACSPCNLLKGNRLLRESGMFLQRAPIEPTTTELQENGRAFPPGYLHESWRDFLYWDSELDQT